MRALSPVKWIKVLGALLLAILVATTGSVVPQLHGKPLPQDGSNLNTQERIEVLERFGSNPGDPELAAFKFPQLFELTCENAKPEDYNALAQVFATRGKESSLLLPAIATLFLKGEIEKLKANPPPKVAFTPAELDTQNIPPQLLEDYRLALTVSGPFLALSEPSKHLPGISYLGESDRWLKLINRFFLDNKGIRAEDFLAYQWSGFCGTGQDSLYVPRSLMVFLSLVKEGRHSEALGAALFLHDDIQSLPNEFSHLLRTYFTIFGIDVSKAALGMLTNLDLQEKFYEKIHNSLLQLAAEGNPKEALLLIKVARQTKRNNHRKYIITLGAVIAPNAGADSFPGGFSSWPPRSRLKPSSKEVQTAIFQFFDEFTTFKTDPYALRSLADLLGELKRPEGKPILEKLHKNPDAKIAKAAAEALARLDQ